MAKHAGLGFRPRVLDRYTGLHEVYRSPWGVPLTAVLATAGLILGIFLALPLINGPVQMHEGSAVVVPEETTAPERSETSRPLPRPQGIVPAGPRPFTVTPPRPSARPTAPVSPSPVETHRPASPRPSVTATASSAASSAPVVPVPTVTSPSPEPVPTETPTGPAPSETPGPTMPVAVPSCLDGTYDEGEVIGSPDPLTCETPG